MGQDSSHTTGPAGAPKPPTLQDLAAILGLSKGAVSQALSDRECTVKVSAATKARVRALAKTLGYRKNLAASSLRTERTGMFGILAAGRVMHMHAVRLSMAVDAFRAMGIAPLVVHDSDIGRAGDEASLAALLNARVDGVLLLNRSAHLQDAHLDELRRYGISIAQVGGRFETPDIAHYVTDRRQAFQLAVDHLAEQGYRRLGLLAAETRGAVGARVGEETRSAVLEAVNKTRNAGIDLELEIFEASTRDTPEIYPLYQPGYSGMQEIIRAGRVPEALICQVDGWALGAMRACSEAGIRIPEDMAITGFSNEPVCSATAIPLTSVEEPFEEMCRAATAELVSAVKERRATEGKCTVMPCRLIVRRSSIRRGD